jgi:hypothetical protein
MWLLLHPISMDDSLEYALGPEIPQPLKSAELNKFGEFLERCMKAALFRECETR